MQRVYSTEAIAITLLLIGSSIAFGQGGGGGLTITNYQLLGEVRSTRTQWFVTYRADLVNAGAARGGVTATVTSMVPTVQVVPGQSLLHFISVPASSSVTSADTFTILVDRSVPFDVASLSWSFLNPLANPGPNQTAKVGAKVTLNGSGSSNPSGVGSLAYRWVLESRPASSQATLLNAGTVMPSFVVDAGGAYVISLTVDNG